MLTALAAAAACLPGPAAAVPLLGHPQWRVREAAAHALKAAFLADEERLLPLVRAAAGHEDAEVADRAAGVLALYYRVLPTGYPVLPWLDSLPPDYPDRAAVVSRYVGRAGWGCWPAAPDFPAYREATRLYVRDLFAAGKTKAEVRGILDGMVPGDRLQVARNPGWRLADGRLKAADAAGASE